MNKLIAFIKKEFIHIFRDWRTLLVLFAIPAIQLIVFGYAISNDLKYISIAVLDKSNDELSRKIITKVSHSKFFKLNYILKNEAEIEALFKKNKVKEVIIFENNFSKNLIKGSEANIQIIADATEPNTANIAVSYTSTMINSFLQEINRGPTKIIQSPLEVKMLYNPNMEASWMFVPGIIALILTLISVMLTSVSIVREKEYGSMELLLVTPLKPSTIIIGKVFPYFFLSLLNISLIFLLGHFLFEVPIRGNIFTLYLISLLYIILALNIGIFISIVVSNQQIAMMLSLVALMLPTILLSGFIFPIENMPILLQILSAIMPPRYFIEALRGIMLKGNGIAELWHDFAIISGAILLLAFLSMKKYKHRLMQ